MTRTRRGTMKGKRTWAVLQLEAEGLCWLRADIFLFEILFLVILVVHVLTNTWARIDAWEDE